MAEPFRIGFVALARTTFDMALASDVTAAARTILEAAGFRLEGPTGLVTDLDAAQAAARELAGRPLDGLVLLQATFADTTMARALVDAVAAPPLLWAVPEAADGGRLRLNSLCGINLAAHALTRRRHPYETLYLPAGDPAAAQRVETLARAGRVRRRLQGARLARLGENPAGFESCLFDADALRARFGIEVVPLELPRVFERIAAAPVAIVDPIQARLRSRVAGLEAVDAAATRGTLATYATLHELAQQRGFQAYALRCWPEFFTELGCAACGAVSLLNDELIPGGCEADVNGTVTQLILQWLSGEPAFGSDLVALHEDLDGLVLWHCGQAPLSMADPATPPTATVHSNRKLPLLMDFTLKPGRVTLARLSQARGDFRLVIGSGTMLQAPAQFSGTSGVLRFTRPAHQVLETILSQGLEHHVAITYGDYVPALRSLAHFLSLPVLEL